MSNNGKSNKKNTYLTWDVSPKKDRNLIRAGRYLNVGFMVGTLLAAPASIAASPWLAAGCVIAAGAAAIGMLFTKYSINDLETVAKAAKGTPAPKDIEDLTRDVFDRAGLSHVNLKVRIIEPNSSPIKRFRRMAYSAAVGISEKNEARVIIGRKTLESLSKDELEAVLCHEASHVANRENIPGMHWSEKLGKVSLAGMYMASALTLNFAGAAYYGAAFAGSFLFNKSLRRLDEYRADYNGVGLSGNPDAMISGLTKTYNSLIRSNNVNMPQHEVDRLINLNNKLWPLANHPAVSNRINHIRNVAAKHNLPCTL